MHCPISFLRRPSWTGHTPSISASSRETEAATLARVDTFDAGWSWDATLYAGSARFYPVGRVAYPYDLAVRLTEALGLDGAGRLLDVGCGPGSLTLLLAPLFADVIGVDADPDMLAEAARQAERHGVGHVRWRHLRAEQLPADLAAPTVITFAQSFHLSLIHI